MRIHRICCFDRSFPSPPFRHSAIPSATAMRRRCQLLLRAFSKPSVAPKPVPPARCSFSTTPRLVANAGAHLPKHVVPKIARQENIIPEYPYGSARLYKQSDRGLYGGQRIQFGNNVSPETETKTRRKWHPNVLSKSLYSIALKKKVKLRVTAKVLRIIDREGGLDEYLLKESDRRIKELGPIGWNLRWTLMQTPTVIERFRNEAKELGIPPEQIDEHWPVTPAWQAMRLQSTQQLQQELLELEQAQGDGALDLASETSIAEDMIEEQVVDNSLEGPASPARVQ
jgi:large subunit ribosomal protein L28